MKNSLLLLILLISILKAHPQSNLWTWVSGDDHFEVAPVYGSKGVASPSNKPGTRSFSAYWTDAEGNFWLFGGTSSLNPFGYLNDLWKYNPSTNEWTWISGENTPNHPGTYGAKMFHRSTIFPVAGLKQSAGSMGRETFGSLVARA